MILYGLLGGSIIVLISIDTYNVKCLSETLLNLSRFKGIKLAW